MTDVNIGSNRRIAKNTFLLYIRVLILLFVSLFTSRVVLDVLGVDDYGIYNLVGGVVAMFSMLSGTMAGASQRFITYALGENDRQRVSRVFSTSVTLHLILGIFIVIILEIFGLWFLYNKLNIPIERLSAAGWVMQCSIFAFFINIISVPYNSLIIAYEKMSAFAYISILDAVLKLGSAYLLWLVGSDKLVAYAIFILIITMIQRAVYSIYCKNHFAEAKHISLKIDGKLFRDMFSFASWNLWGTGSAVLRNQGVDIILNLFFGVTINAAKGICNQVQNGVYQFVGNFQTAVYPQLTMSVAQRDYVRTRTLIFQGGRFSFYLMIFFSLPIMVATPQILSLWLSVVPDYTVVFIRWTFIYLLCDTLSRFLVTSILANGNIKNYQIIVGSTKLLALPFIYIILKFGGTPLVSIWVIIGLELVCLTQRLYFCRKYIGLSAGLYLRNVFLKCWSVFILAAAIPFYVSFSLTSNLWILLITSVCSASLVICFVGLSLDEKKKISQKIVSVVYHKFHP
ncbi:MATE family efflux transporter [Bacteroides sp. GD17]|jgi:O-antigen/teichoic acid export membrane protein|uniref:lipopolysaccharide biosynthesis protein n=1 Tax=Bacteroides sp. GD17 TaxID=3139826 RepID=UPI0025FB2C48|nr:MATE family efflux transporter [uncultured Bacteroides sp.]